MKCIVRTRQTLNAVTEFQIFAEVIDPDGASNENLLMPSLTRDQPVLTNRINSVVFEVRQVNIVLMTDVASVWM